jgi:hypothetical protein
MVRLSYVVKVAATERDLIGSVGCQDIINPSTDKKLGVVAEASPKVCSRFLN